MALFDRTISVEEFEELIDKDELIETLLNLGLIEEETTMHKLIKVTPDYWGNNGKPSYWPFTQDKVNWVIENYTNGILDDEDDLFKLLLDGDTSKKIYARQNYRDLNDPSGHYIQIVELSDEIKGIFDEADDLVKKLKELSE